MHRISLNAYDRSYSTAASIEFKGVPDVRATLRDLLIIICRLDFSQRLNINIEIMPLAPTEPSSSDEQQS